MIESYSRELNGIRIQEVSLNFVVIQFSTKGTTNEKNCIKGNFLSENKFDYDRSLF